MDELTKQITTQAGVWTERIFVVTNDFEVRGYVFLPKTGKKNRILTDILNSNKKFIAIKDCHIKYRLDNSEEHQEFIQLNINSIIMLRPDKA